MLHYENPIVVTQVVRQILTDHESLIVERVLEGRSTAVYRVWNDDAILYLRILPEQSASYAPEAYVHATLRAQGLLVPEVVYFEHYNPIVQRSVMLTTSIMGRAIGGGSYPVQVHQIARQAGRELAQINRLSVQGFGWVQRPANEVHTLSAEYATYQEWMAHHFDASLSILRQWQGLTPPDHHAIQAALAEAITVFGQEPAVLAHGDFDATHIYQHNGRYTGIIDFGEMRGTHLLYDIGHFWIENRDLLPSLLEGYAEVVALPADCWRHIHLTGLLIAARRLGIRLAKQGNVHEPDVQAVQRAIQVLNT